LVLGICKETTAARVPLGEGGLRGIGAYQRCQVCDADPELTGAGGFHKAMRNKQIFRCAKNDVELFTDVSVTLFFSLN
jgi:hypothetical protein